MTPFKSYELKIKTVSLALEGALIHQNESKLKQQIKRCKASNHPDRDTTLARLRADRDSLRIHRKGIVRWAARDAGLAYGFLRGRAYNEIEIKRYSDPDWKAIETMVLKYGERAGGAQVLKQNFERWKQEAASSLTI